MKVINPPYTNFDLYFIPRDYNIQPPFNLRLRNSRTDDFIDNDIFTPLTDNKGYYFYNADYPDFDIQEGDTLDIKIYKGNIVIYRGLIYATSQTDLQNFKLNDINANVIDL